jgi:hypothetical protein
VTRKIIITDYEFGTFVSYEIPMEDEWPAGDPCPKDKETLVLYSTRITNKGTVGDESV